MPYKMWVGNVFVGENRHTVQTGNIVYPDHKSQALPDTELFYNYCTFNHEE